MPKRIIKDKRNKEKINREICWNVETDIEKLLEGSTEPTICDEESEYREGN